MDVPCSLWVWVQYGLTRVRTQYSTGHTWVLYFVSRRAGDSSYRRSMSGLKGRKVCLRSTRLPMSSFLVKEEYYIVISVDLKLLVYIRRLMGGAGFEFWRFISWGGSVKTAATSKDKAHCFVHGYADMKWHNDKSNQNSSQTSAYPRISIYSPGT